MTGAASRRQLGAATASAGAILLLPRAARALLVSGRDASLAISDDARDDQLRHSLQGKQPALDRGQINMILDPVVRVSILRCDAAQFDDLRKMMSDSEAVLRPGIEQMPGLLAFYGGADTATFSLMNTSLWDTLEHAQQLDRFQPMLDAGKRFAAAGARFERPIMNYATLWRFGPVGETCG